MDRSVQAAQLPSWKAAVPPPPTRRTPITALLRPPSPHPPVAHPVPQETPRPHLPCRTDIGPHNSPQPLHRRSGLLRTRAADGDAVSTSSAGRRGRHPELRRRRSARSPDAGGSDPGQDSGSQMGEGGPPGSPVVEAKEPPRPEEVDERYRRADYSEVFQFESRQAFVRAIAGGEPRMRLAEAALHVTAEDDAIASHSTVPFPVAAWTDRIERLVDSLCSINLRRAATAVSATSPHAVPRTVAATTAPPPGSAAATASGSGADAAAAVEAEAAGALRVVERFLFEESGFRMPDYGRSHLPANAIVDHPGVWEDARLGYLHEMLIRRQGHPAALGLLLGEVCNRLLARGVLPCAAAIDTRAFLMLPRAVPLPQLTRDVLMTHGSASTAQGSEMGDVGAGGSSLDGALALNTCTSEVLVEMLRHLKRSFWPFAWDTSVDLSYPDAVGSHGGFRAAAKAVMGDEVSAALEAIAKVAAWRLERGIWTSPGAGDIRRARAASERLVLLAGERCPEERRDLAVLLIHCGELGAAKLELRTYLQTVNASPGPSPTPGASTLPSWAFGASGRGPDPFDVALCRRLLKELEGLGGSEAGIEPGSVLEEPTEPLGLEAALRAVPPWERAVPAGRRPLPLTW